MKKYEGKVFAITGATGGIGKAICKKFAHKKLCFYLLDLPGSNFKELEDEIMELGARSVESLELDVTNHEQVKDIIKKIGKKENYIDILVNNAGIGNKTSITNGGTIEEFRKIWKVNVEGPWIITQAALPYLGRPVKKPPKKNPNQREGQVMFMSSTAGKLGIPYMAAYCASKHAVVGMAASLRMEFQMKNEKIHVITICPAPVETKFWSSTEDYEAWMEKYKKHSRIYSVLQPEDVAKAIFKASKKNKREVFVPRWYSVVANINTYATGLIDKMLIRIENTNLEN